jgi:hypothetical protein
MTQIVIIQGVIIPFYNNMLSVSSWLLDCVVYVIVIAIVCLWWSDQLISSMQWVSEWVSEWVSGCLQGWMCWSEEMEWPNQISKFKILKSSPTPTLDHTRWHTDFWIFSTSRFYAKIINDQINDQNENLSILIGQNQ